MTSLESEVEILRKENEERVSMVSQETNSRVRLEVIVNELNDDLSNYKFEVERLQKVSSGAERTTHSSLTNWSGTRSL